MTIGAKTVDAASSGVKGIKTELTKVQGLLQDLKSNAAANQSNFTVTGNAASVFNSAGSLTAPINNATDLVTQTAGQSAATSIFNQAGSTSATLLTATTGNVANDLVANDVLRFTIGGKQVNFKVVTAAVTAAAQLAQSGVEGADAAATLANAISVRTIGDLVNALNGKTVAGTALNVTARFNDDDRVNAGFDTTSPGAPQLSLAANSAGTITRGAGGAAGAAAPTILTNAITAQAAAANQFRNGDIVQFKVGSTNNGGTQQSLFVKVVKNFSGLGNTQAGDGLSASAGGGSSGALEVKSIGDFINALNGKTNNGTALAGFTWGSGNTLSATFDSSTSTGAAQTRLRINTGSALNISVNRAGAVAATSTDLFGGTGGVLAGTGINATSSFNVASTLTTTAVEKRTAVAVAFRASMDQINQYTNDANFGGNNLLKDTTGYLVDLKEDAGNSTVNNITTSGKLRLAVSKATDTTSLGFAVPINGVYQDGAQNNFLTNATDIDPTLLKIEGALAQINGRGVELDNLTDTLKIRKEFNSSIVTGLGSASNDLTVLDQAEATAEAQAISFSNSIATKFLGTISQRSQQLLQLF
jgi:hypothetical protein